MKIKAKKQFNANDFIKASFYENQISMVFCLMHSTTLNVKLVVQHYATNKGLNFSALEFLKSLLSVLKRGWRGGMFKRIDLNITPYHIK